MPVLDKGIPDCQNICQEVYLSDIEHTTHANYAFRLLTVNLGSEINSVDFNVMYEILHDSVGNLELTL